MKKRAIFFFLGMTICMHNSDHVFAYTETEHETFFGVGAGFTNTASGNYNTFLGRNAGHENTTGDANTFLGYYAGYSNTTGDSNTFLGYRVGRYNTTGDYNTFLGREAGNSNTSGESNTFIGRSAGYANTTGGYNTFLGSSAGYSNITGNSNTFLGYYAGNSNTSGGSNTFLGYRSGYLNTTGGSNTFLGSFAGDSNTTGGNNTFLGCSAGQANTTGGYNTFLGNYAGYSSTTSNYNTFLGYSAGESNTTGGNNTFLGYRSGYLNTSGAGNVLIGYKAGYNETGSNKLYIANSDSSSPLIYGEFDNDLVKIHGTLEMAQSVALSDARMKKNVQSLNGSLTKVSRLEGVSFDWKTKEYSDRGLSDNKQIGLIAQDVEKVLPELVITGADGYKAVSYDKLTAVLVEAVKELKSENQVLKTLIEEQQAILKTILQNKIYSSSLSSSSICMAPEGAQ